MAAQGEAMLPLLQAGILQGTDEQQQACLRALALIGTPVTLQVLAALAHRDDGTGRQSLWSNWQCTLQPGTVLVTLLGEHEGLVPQNELEPGTLVTTLDGLHYASTLKRLEVRDCPEGRDLRSLASLIRLERVSLWDARACRIWGSWAFCVYCGT